MAHPGSPARSALSASPAVGSRPAGVGFWIRWVIASLAGFVVGFAGLFALLAPLGGPERLGVPFTLAFPVFLAIVGALVGAGQWLVLRRHASGTGAWVWATAAGVGLGFAVIFNLLGEGSGLVGKIVEGLQHGAVLGICLGVPQALVLRGKVARPERYAAASTVAWAVAAATGDAVGFYAGGPFDLLTGFTVGPAITGAALVRLLR